MTGLGVVVVPLWAFRLAKRQIQRARMPLQASAGLGPGWMVGGIWTRGQARQQSATLILRAFSPFRDRATWSARRRPRSGARSRTRSRWVSMPAWLKAGSAFPAGELLARRAGFRQSESLIQLAGRAVPNRNNCCIPLGRNHHCSPIPLGCPTRQRKGPARNE